MLLLDSGVGGTLTSKFVSPFLMLSHNETLGKTKAYIFNKELKTVPYVRHMQQYDHFGGVYLVNGDLDSETLLNMLEPALTRGK